MTAKRILTLAELETTTCLGTTGLLTLYLAAVTRHEAFCTQGLLVLGIYFHQGTGDSQTHGLRLTSETTTIQVHLNVILLSDIQESQGLLNYELQDGAGEILCKISLIDGYLTIAFAYIYTGHSGLTTAYCIYYFHRLLFKDININCFRTLSLLLVLCTGINIKVADQLASQLVLGRE